MNTLVWQAQEVEKGVAPQTIAGVVAQAAVVTRLLQRLQQEPPDTLARWSFVACRDLLVVLGADVPWVDGLRYCAPHPQARALWLPCHTQPTISLDLLQSALQRRLRHDGPLLLWHAPEEILPLTNAQALSPQLLLWLVDSVVDEVTDDH